VVGPEDPLRVAFMRMRAADISQFPVVDGDRIIGLVDESDMLGAVLEVPGARSTC
jgi:cystathionine beta-synthase